MLAFPEVALHRYTRCHDHGRLYDLLTVLFDFRHTGAISMWWEYALSLCAKADAGPDGTEKERFQVRMLHDRRFRSLIDRPEMRHMASPARLDIPWPVHH